VADASLACYSRVLLACQRNPSPGSPLWPRVGCRAKRTRVAGPQRADTTVYQDRLWLSHRPYSFRLLVVRVELLVGSPLPTDDTGLARVWRHDSTLGRRGAGLYWYSKSDSYVTWTLNTSMWVHMLGVSVEIELKLDWQVFKKVKYFKSCNRSMGLTRC